MNSTRHTVATLPDMLKAAAEQRPSTGYTFAENSGTTRLSYADLLIEATTWAGQWQQLGIKPGERVLLIMPTSHLFAPLYWGLLLAGIVPCLLPSPGLVRGAESGLQRVREVGLKLGTRWLLTTAAEQAQWQDAKFPFTVKRIEDVKPLPGIPFQPPTLNPQDPAIIQATSGATTNPKCVVLTHANLLANLRQIGDHLPVSAEDVVVSWLPLFHDMGLIGCFLFAAYWQLPSVFMPPARFIRRPARWLQAITDHKGTLSPAPNFAYALALQRVTETEQARLDLSSWRSAICGAEPINGRILQAFAARFQSSGLQPEALTPCYGLAEASLCVTMHAPGTPMQIETVWRETAVTGQIIQSTNGHEPPAQKNMTQMEVCGCGSPVTGTKIEIRDEQGHALEEGCVGQIWVSSPSIMQGYFDDNEQTNRVLQNGWLDTGDLGYMRQGQLFVVGRLKETIIIRGQNYFPTDFEQAAAQVPQVKMGRVAAIGLYADEESTEQLHLIVEHRSQGSAEDGALILDIKRQVAQKTGILPTKVLLVPRHTLSHTTSGKLQRHQLKTNYPQVRDAAWLAQ